MSDFCEILRGKQNSVRHKTPNFENSTWQRAAIWKIVKLLYRKEQSSNFDEILYTTADLELDDSH